MSVSVVYRQVLAALLLVAGAIGFHGPAMAVVIQGYAPERHERFYQWGDYSD